MRMSVAFLGALAGSVLASSSALADKAAYCQAYARDFSDARATDKAEWQHKYEIALDACLANGKAAEAQPQPAPAKPAAVKPAPKAAPKPVVAALPEKTTDEPVVKPAAADEMPKLVEGSPEWNDYCTKKYTSFDAKTGMYMSHTGVQRHCLVTKDFKG